MKTLSIFPRCQEREPDPPGWDEMNCYQNGRILWRKVLVICLQSRNQGVFMSDSGMVHAKSVHNQYSPSPKKLSLVVGTCEQAHKFIYFAAPEMPCAPPLLHGKIAANCPWFRCCNRRKRTGIGQIKFKP